jgi:5-methyltetrahydropteroyltriglutamate--homocysteine methyltransferase
VKTTTIGSYPVPDWLPALPSEQARLDATRVVFDIQRQAGIDLPADGELYRFDVNIPDTNGMIDYFVRPMGGIRSRLSRSESDAFAQVSGMSFRARAAGVIVDRVCEGSLNLLADCRLTASVAGGPFKFTVTSPYMLARTLLDCHYREIDAATMAIAEVLGGQVAGLPCDCLQVDEANVPGSPEHWKLAADAINTVLRSYGGPLKAVHLCFGNYGGQTIQRGTWKSLVQFMNRLEADHVLLECAHRPEDDLIPLRDVRPDLHLGIGVVDIKVNHIETADEIARRIETAERIIGPARVRWVNPDCGFWMLKRSVADRKIAALVAGRNLYLDKK